MIWLLPTVLACSPARADALLASKPEIVTFCERCGDRVPGEPHLYAGERLDFATTYVHTQPQRYENLALLAGCSSEGAVPSLHVEDDHGMLIVPDDAAVTPLVVNLDDEPDPHYELVAVLSMVGTAGAFLFARRLRRRRRHRPRL
jgi:hypothetical protein